jgi:adenylosuccinate synthase
MGVGETVELCATRVDLALRWGAVGRPRLQDVLEELAVWADTTIARLGQPLPELPSPEAIAATFLDAHSRVARGLDAPGLRDAQDTTVVFEGAQGVLLDEWYGFHPYTTWSTTTFEGAEAFGLPVFRLGVLRTVTTRHGPGPMPTEDAKLQLAEPHNGTGLWQGRFRAGHYDAVAHRYAIEACQTGVDGIALTHLDTAQAMPDLRISDAWCWGDRTRTRLPIAGKRDLDYQEFLTHAAETASPVLRADPVTEWEDTVTTAIGVPVVVTSHGPTASDKIGDLPS